MRVLTRSRRIREALRTVFSRIPGKDRRLVESSVVRIRTETGWRMRGLSGELDKSGGRVLPSFEAGTDSRKEKNQGSQVVFTLPICRLYSNKGLVGLVAHELAHTLRAAKLGSEWYEKMDRRYTAEERVADAIASCWGFRSYIQAFRHEQETFVLPALYSREPQIVRSLERRSLEQQELAMFHFEFLPDWRARNPDRSTVPLGEFYADYAAWCRERGTRVLSRRKVRELLNLLAKVKTGRIS